MVFRANLDRVAKTKESNIVLALDFPFEKQENRKRLFSKAERVLEAVQPYLCAVKFNHHLVLPLGLFDGVQKLVKRTHELGLIALMDCKVNDIGATNQVIAQYYYDAGFDALIANPLVGWEEGLRPIFEVAKPMRRGIILLVYMSHKAASEGYGQIIIDAETGKEMPQYLLFARRALEHKADGVVVGATYPEKIEEIHRMLGKEIPIFSPGIGAQGGEIQLALRAGADYIILGRSVAQAENPAESARRMKELINMGARGLK